MISTMMQQKITKILIISKSYFEIILKDWKEIINWLIDIVEDSLWLLGHYLAKNLKDNIFVQKSLGVFVQGYENGQQTT